MADLLKTSLHEEHLSLKAKMAPFAGYEMPLQYSSVKEETKAVREGCGVFDVSHMGEFFIEGEQASDFVDFLLTNDFKGAEVGKAVYSPLCNESGTIIDDLIAYKLEEKKVLICVNAANIKKDYEWIAKHASKFSCELSDRSESYSLLAVQGPRTVEVLKSLDVLSTEDQLDYYSAAETTSPFGSLILARTGYTGEDGFEIFGSHESIKKLWPELLKKDVTPCGLASRDVLRLEVCFPLYGHELSEEWTPLDAGLKWTVKMKKPQFIGKEALEAHEPKLRLVKLSLDKGIPREGYDVLNEDGEKVGTVTSGTMSVTLSKGIALALINRESFPKNKEFLIKVRNNHFKANYHTKPFVSGGHK